MTEWDFDRMLEHAAEDLPDDIPAEVTPWRRAIGHIIGGSGLCAITIHILRLEILLPTVGMILHLLGFRALRRENGWFLVCWLLAALRACIHLPILVLNATIYSNLLSRPPLVSGISAVLSAAQLLLFFCFWQGLRSARKKAGMPAQAGSAGALFAWYLAVTALGLIQYSGWLAAILMLAGYFCILRSLFQLSREMEEQGYAIRPASVRISDGTLIRVILAVLAAGIACGYLFFGSYPMHWQPVSRSLDVQVSQVREELLSLGYPEAALWDLSVEDLLSCRGALQVVAQERDEAVNPGRQVRETEGNHVQISTVYDVKELHLTDVAVQLPGDRENWRIFHHFFWSINPGFRGTEALQLWPAYRRGEGWSAGTPPTGRVLYDADGSTYAAPYYSLAQERYTTQSPLWGTQHATDLFAAFSLPSRGENQRGYVSYGILASSAEKYLVDSWINYTHQESRLQYPVLTAQENRRRSSWNRSFPFFTVQNALQFFSQEDGAERIGPEP